MLRCYPLVLATLASAATLPHPHNAANSLQELEEDVADLARLERMLVSVPSWSTMKNAVQTVASDALSSIKEKAGAAVGTALGTALDKYLPWATHSRYLKDVDLTETVTKMVDLQDTHATNPNPARSGRLA